MELTLEQVSDEGGARRWHALEARNVPVDHPGMVADPVEEVLQLATGTDGAERCTLYLGVADGVDVANATMWLPMLDNVQHSTINFAVDAGNRRRGVGTEFVRQLHDVARAAGRRRSRSFVATPLDATDDAPGTVLARRLGATPALEAVRRQLELDVVTDEWCDALLATHVGGRADGYEVVTWLDVIPEELVDGAARLMARMTLDAPMGSIEWEAEVWDAARYREKEAQAKDRGRQRVAAGAVDRRTGRLVAYTDIGVSVIERAVGYQWDTIVDPEHRGHRLGLAVKLENLRQLRTASPDTTRLQTWNAASNAHMIRINDLVGFRGIERSTHWQLAI